MPSAARRWWETPERAEPRPLPLLTASCSPRGGGGAGGQGGGERGGRRALPAGEPLRGGASELPSTAGGERPPNPEPRERLGERGRLDPGVRPRGAGGGRGARSPDSRASGSPRGSGPRPPPPSLFSSLSPSSSPSSSVLSPSLHPGLPSSPPPRCSPGRHHQGAPVAADRPWGWTTRLLAPSGGVMGRILTHAPPQRWALQVHPKSPLPPKNNK